jgi:hypothetical protein
VGRVSPVGARAGRTPSCGVSDSGRQPMIRSPLWSSLMTAHDPSVAIVGHDPHCEGRAVPAENQLAAANGSRDSQPAGCRFDSYAAHQFSQVTALPANGGSSQCDQTIGLVSGNLERRAVPLSVVVTGDGAAAATTTSASPDRRLRPPSRPRPPRKRRARRRHRARHAPHTGPHGRVQRAAHPPPPRSASLQSTNGHGHRGLMAWWNS